jgi:hypothetical protein
MAIEELESDKLDEIIGGAAVHSETSASQSFSSFGTFHDSSTQTGSPEGSFPSFLSGPGAVQPLASGITSDGGGNGGTGYHQNPVDEVQQSMSSDSFNTQYSNTQVDSSWSSYGGTPPTSSDHGDGQGSDQANNAGTPSPNQGSSQDMSSTSDGSSHAPPQDDTSMNGDNSGHDNSDGSPDGGGGGGGGDDGGDGGDS